MPIRSAWEVVPAVVRVAPTFRTAGYVFVCVLLLVGKRKLHTLRSVLVAASFVSHWS